MCHFESKLDGSTRLKTKQNDMASENFRKTDFQLKISKQFWLDSEPVACNQAVHNHTGW